MPLEQLLALFKWMTIINVSIFIASSILAIVLKNTVNEMHGKLFGIEKTTVARVHYGYLGAYRIFILVFNIVPYISLVIIK